MRVRRCGSGPGAVGWQASNRLERIDATDAVGLGLFTAVFASLRLSVGAMARGKRCTSRATLARWMVCSGSLVQPLFNLLRDEMLALDYIHIDETTVQVLKESGKSAHSTSYIWAQQRTDPIVLHPVIAARKHLIWQYRQDCSKRA